MARSTYPRRPAPGLDRFFFYVSIERDGSRPELLTRFIIDAATEPEAIDIAAGRLRDAARAYRDEGPGQLVCRHRSEAIHAESLIP